MMNKFFTLLLTAFTLISFNSNAASGNIDLSGRTLTDTDGTVWDLEQLQDDNYIIIFDFWATWCGPCIGSIPGLDEIWEDHGPMGDQTYIVFSIETDNATNNELDIIEQYGIQNPVIIGNSSTSVQSNEFAYTGSIPYFTVVCPNGDWQDKTGGIGNNPSLLTGLASSCGVVSSIVTDARVLNVEIEKECPEQDTWIPKVNVKNIGSTNMTSAKIEIKVDGAVVETIDWTGDLAQGTSELVDANPVTFTGIGVQEIEANLIEFNGSADQNALNNTATGSKSYIISEELTIQIELIIDSYPEETSYSVKAEDGTILSSVATGAYNGASSNPIINVTLPSFEECYTIDLIDSYGDGSGGIIITDSISGDTLLINKTAYTTLQENKLYTSADSDGDGYTDIIEELAGSDKNNNSSNPLNVAIKDLENVSIFNVYPNPVSDVLNIQLETKSNEKVSIELVNILGEIVAYTTVKNGMATINTSNLSKGIYMINAISEGKSIATSNIVVR